MSTETPNTQNLIEQLTLEEKIRLVHGAIDPEGTATGYIPGVERLSIPELRFADGPLGVRARGKPATSFPASIALAATFDPELGREQGAAMGREARERNQDVLLGPGVNLIRTPQGGRNFEYFSEDPVMTAAFARTVVEGIESEDVVATPKHFVANNQETNRATIDVEVSEQALRECYLPGFRAAVDAGAGSVMSAYNSVNGSFMSEHRRLLSDVLKEEWEFDGFVVSDWFGTVSTVDSANAGLDLEMPGISGDEMMAMFGVESEENGVFGESEEVSGGMPDMTSTGQFADPLLKAVQDGKVAEEQLDDMVRRILEQMKRIGRFDNSVGEDTTETGGHQSLAKSVATRGTVLLKNDDVLPLEDDVEIAVFGPGVDQTTSGGGSSEMDALHETTTVEGIKNRADGQVTVEHGIRQIEQFSFFGGDETDHDNGSDPQLSDATEAAAVSDVAVVVVQDAAAEAKDRENLKLPGEQDKLIEEVAAVNDNTIVIVQSSGPVELPWRDDVQAILETWYPGQSDGDALAEVLFGDADAGGRLPVTFTNEADYPLSAEEAFPGVDDTVKYTENLFVGYKHFDASDTDPVYPFGHGVSYAEFVYHSVEVVGERRIRVTIENTASRDGQEVIQVYAGSAEATDENRPSRELAGFTSQEVQSGETTTVDIELQELAFEKYSETEGWAALEGPFTLEIGRSASDIRLETTL